MTPMHSRRSIFSALIWKLLERGGTQGVQFIVQIVLARLLLPDDYGLLAIVVIFITFAGVLVQSGLNTALIQKKEADALDFSSVFYLSLVFAALLYGVLFLTAPLIASFYEAPQLVPVLRVLALTLFVGALNSIQNAWVSRHMLFKKLFFSSFGAIIVSGTIGIVLAKAGLGIWALVAQQLAGQCMVAAILWFTVRWRPQRLFALARVKTLFSYGWKLMTSSLIDTLYQDLRGLIIGKIYTPAMLGFYNRGQQFPRLIVTNINGSIQSVLLPALSSHQDNRDRVRAMTRRAIASSSFILFPIMAGMAVVAEPAVRFLLTDKWLDAVPFLQIYCAVYALMPVHTANLQAINALGRSDIFLRLELIKKSCSITILLVSVPLGIMAIAWGSLLNSLISSVINAWPNKKLLGYAYGEQLRDLLPSLLLALAMGAVIWPILLLNLAPWLTLLLQVTAGAVFYLGLARIMHLESLTYLLATAGQFWRGRGEETP